jgi:hypothetical protein
MAQFPFVGGSYTSRSKNFDAQRCVNLFPVLSESGTSKSVAALFGTPGLLLWTTLAGGNVRGLLRFNATTALAVVGGSVYKVTSAGTSTLIGTIVDDTTPVSMDSNGTYVMLVTGQHGYFINMNTNTVTAITDADFTGADKVGFLDGYFVFNKRNTGQFQITGLYDTTIDALNFATAEGAPDLLVSLLIDHREVWLFGETSVELFYNSGNTDFPITRVDGAFMEHGCAAAFSVAKLDNSVFWLSADNSGKGIIYRATGYTPEPISTEAVSYAIGQMERIDDAIAYAYQQEGHSFYVITFPTAQQTWAYDTKTNLWHERAYRAPADGSLGRHRANCHMEFAGHTIVGDYENGNLYIMDLDTFSDNGAVIPRIRSCPHISNDYLMQFFHSLQIDFEAGVGLTSGLGGDPKALLEWSDDGGHSWKGQYTVSIGKKGERRARAVWRRLGRSRDRVFRVTVTDPVKVAILGASVDYSLGAA